jgi:hypothetical protein
MTTLLQLQSVIERRRTALNDYVAKPNASNFFIQKENDFIAELIEIHNHFESILNLKFQTYWIQIESEIERLMKIDTEIGYANIMLILNEKNSGIYLNINPYA